MRIFQDFDSMEEIKRPVLTIGTFDGVHLGHQKILERVKKEAEKIDGESVLFTFYPHPRMVLFPESHGLKLLQTQTQKIERLKEFGLDNVIVYPFTKDFSQLTAIEFVRDFLVGKLKVQKLVIGYDHQFGKNREGTLEFLKDAGKEYGFEVIEIPAQEIDEVNVSSTKIRQAVQMGDIEMANAYLGEPYELSGIVVHGDHLGRTIGFPTANLETDSELKLIPANGVYGVEVLLPDGAKNQGMMNIGVRPTIGGKLEKRIEIHIFDFEENIYEKPITVRLLKRFREEQKFKDLNSLKTQIQVDEKIIRSYFASVSSE